jgi:hypothetical protein
MNQEIKEKWVKALRSGEYPQGTLALNDCGKFCCLGVLCDMYSKETGEPWVESEITQGKKLIHSEEGLLPYEVRYWSGANTSDGQLPFLGRQKEELWLANLNDGGMPFGQIADLIEHCL